MALLAILVLLGPAQTLAGKFPPPPEEPVALPTPLPDGVAELCALVEGGRGTPLVYEALGDALHARGDGELAYRAYRKAHDGHPDPRALQGKIDRCPAVPDDVIEREETEARLWVDQLAAYRRLQIEHGRDPDDLAGFYERFGRAEDDLLAVVRAHQLSFAGGLAGLMIGFGFLLAGSRVRRRWALLPLLFAVLLVAMRFGLGRVGLLDWGAALALLGGLVTLRIGRTA